jgi:hypothetical protein
MTNMFRFVTITTGALCFAAGEEDEDGKILFRLKQTLVLTL